MPFPHPLTAAELTLARTTDYRAATNLAYCPQAVVFQARVNGGIASGVFAQVAYDTVTVGAYTDIRPGMTVYFGVGSDIRYASLITRVRKTPTSAILYIGESATVLQGNDFITVVNDYGLWEKLGKVTSAGAILVDWEETFKKPAPHIGNLQSVYIDPRASGIGTFVFAPTGCPLAQDATTTLTWLWDVADGTITVGTTTTQTITATFPQGQRWVRVTVTDSNGVTNFRVLWVNVGLTYTLQDIENPAISGSLEDGWNLSINVFDRQDATVLRSLPENTLLVVYTAEIFGDGSTTPIVTHIDFIGRTFKENGHSAGDELWSTLQTGALELEGFGSQLNRLSSPQVGMIHDTTPTQWGEVNRPTVPRFIGHLCSNFNTLSNICSLHFNIPFTYRATTVNTDATVTVADTSILMPGMGVAGTGIPGGATVLSITDKTTFELSANATATGTNTLVFTPTDSDQVFISQSLNITETSAGAALDRIGKWINAGMDYAQSGEIEIRRHAFFLTGGQKSGLATIASTTGTDFQEYTLDIVYPDTIGRAFTGAEFFSTTLNETRYITGSAPPVARGNGEGQATEDGQILTADIDDSAIITELNVRTAALYADSQPKDKLDALFYDGWRGQFVPSRSRWYVFTIAAANNPMGRIYSTATRWLCVSVAYNMLLESGEIANRATFLKEPVVGSAQVSSAISPALVEPALPDLPAFSPYPAMELAGTINYPTDGIPADADVQPIDSYSASYGDEEVAGNFPPPGCRNYNIMLNDSTGITTPALTNAATYTVRAQGYGEIDSAGVSETYDYNHLPVGFTLTGGEGTLDATGFIDSDDLGGTAYVIFFCSQPVSGVSNIRWVFNEATEKAWQIYRGAGVDSGASVPSSIGGGEYKIDVPYTPDITDTITEFLVRQSPVGTATVFKLKRIEVTSAGGVTILADAFYYFYASNVNEGFPYTGFGLTFDGAPPNTLPPYNTNHTYNTTLTGDGSTVVIKFSDTTYSDNAAAPLKVRICGAAL